MRVHKLQTPPKYIFLLDRIYWHFGIWEIRSVTSFPPSYLPLLRQHYIVQNRFIPTLPHGQTQISKCYLLDSFAGSLNIRRKGQLVSILYMKFLFLLLHWFPHFLRLLRVWSVNYIRVTFVYVDVMLHKMAYFEKKIHLPF